MYLSTTVKAYGKRCLVARGSVGVIHGLPDTGQFSAVGRQHAEKFVQCDRLADVFGRIRVGQSDGRGSNGLSRSIFDPHAEQPDST